MISFNFAALNDQQHYRKMKSATQQKLSGISSTGYKNKALVC